MGRGRREADAADILIAQGTEAGGHGASRTTIDIVPAIVDLVAGRVPVVAAGGIGDGRGLAAMMMLGASGVLLGTRFYASQECDGAEDAKKRICAATSNDTTRGVIFDLSRNNVWPAPFTGRCLINDHARRWMGREPFGATPHAIVHPMPAGPRRRWPARSASSSPDPASTEIRLLRTPSWGGADARPTPPIS